MPLSQINNGDGTRTLRFDYTHPSQKVVDGAEHAVKFLYGRMSPTEQAALGPYAALTPAQKGAILFNAVGENLKGWSEADIRAEEDTARAAILEQRFTDEGLG